MANIPTARGHLTRRGGRKRRKKSRLLYIIPATCLVSLYVGTTVFLATRNAGIDVSRSSEWKLGGTNEAEPLESWVRNLNLSTDSTFPGRPAFGFVMRDFARRVLSRHIASSNVLVVSPDATRAAKHGIRVKANNHTAKNPYDDVDFQSPYSIGGTFLLHAAFEGHDIHAIDFGSDQSGSSVEWSTSLDQWWAAFTNSNARSSEDPRRWSSSKSTPKWILAAIFDNFHPTNFDLIDQVWTGADQFLNETTITYVVVALHSRKVNDTYQYGGLAAARALLDRRYRLQTLMLSHYHTDPGKEFSTEQKYGPNALFKTTEDVQDLLRWGADAVKRLTTGHNDQHFTAYIFGTQGLDLAIPSNRIFIDDKSRVIGDESSPQINLYKPLEFKPCPQSLREPKLDISFTKVGKRIFTTTCHSMSTLKAPFNCVAPGGNICKSYDTGGRIE